MSSGPVVVRTDGRLGVVPPENDYDIVTVPLSTARAAPGVEILSGGSSISGTSVSVAMLTGTAQIKFNSTAKPAYTLLGAEPFVLDFTKIYVVNVAQPVGELVLWIGKRA